MMHQRQVAAATEGLSAASKALSEVNYLRGNLIQVAATRLRGRGMMRKKEVEAPQGLLRIKKHS